MGKISKTLTILLILIFLTSMALLPNGMVKAQSKTITVPDDYTDIQTAINNANNGDTVFVKNGVYDGTIIINKAITLIGEDCNKTVLTTPRDPKNQENYENIHFFSLDGYVGVGNVCISGFTIEGGKEGINAWRFSSLNLTNNIFKNCERGLILDRCSNCIVSGNQIINNKIGLIFTGTNSLINDNYIANNNRTGLIVGDGYDSLSYGKPNNVFINSWGIEIKGNSIINNGLINGGFYDGGLILSGNKGALVYENNMTNNFGAGVVFASYCNNDIIYHNLISKNNIGVLVNNYVVTYNSNAELGNATLGTNNTIYGNHFLLNKKQAFVETASTDDKSWSYTWINGTDEISWSQGNGGNYWSDYNGSGKYVIDQNNIDHYPLTQEVDVNSIAPTPTSVITSDFNSLVALTTPFIAVIVIAISLLFYRRHRKTTKT